MTFVFKVIKWDITNKKYMKQIKNICTKKSNVKTYLQIKNLTTESKGSYLKTRTVFILPIFL